MELIIDRNSLVGALTLAMPFASAKSPIALAKFCKCTTKGNRMKIESYDSQGGIVRYLDLDDCNEDVSFLMNVADVNKLVGKIRVASIKLIVEGDTVTIKHNKGNADFTVPAVEEYPAFQTSGEDVVTLTIPTSVLREAVNVGKNFISNNNLRPQLCAIYANATEGFFEFCATDTRCLVYNKFAVDGNDVSGSFYIMPSIFSAIVDGCKMSDTVAITFNANHVTYKFGPLTVMSCQAKGNFPPFERVIPKTHTYTCNVDSNEMLESLGRVSMFCDEQSCVKAVFNMIGIELYANNLTEGNTSTEHIGHNGCDGELNVGLNSEVLTKCLKAYGGGEMEIKMNTASSPIVFKHDSIPNMTVLMMPMVLQDN